MALPAFTEKFPSSEISNIQLTGTVSSSRDPFNNIPLNLEQNSASGSLLSLPISNTTYNSKYIESFFETEFTEFVETP